MQDVKEHTVQIIKYFRKNHMAKAKFSAAEGKGLVLPSDDRWTVPAVVADCLEAYVTQWDIIHKICKDNSKDIIMLSSKSLKHTREACSTRVFI